MIGRALKIMRVLNDLSGEEMAEVLRISNSYLSEIETEKKQPTIQMLKIYADVFEIKLSTLLVFNERLECKDRHTTLHNRLMNTVLALMEFIEKGKE